MSETPYVETEALLALMSGDTNEAQRIIDEMLPGERRALSAAAESLAARSDDTNRCQECHRYVPWPSASRVLVGIGSRQTWHAECYERAKEVSR